MFLFTNKNVVTFIVNQRMLFFELLVMTIFLLAISMPQSADARYVFENMWGQYGSGNGQFAWPNDVAVYSSGNIFPSVDVFVTEELNHRIQKFHIANPCPTGTTEIVAGICFVTKWGTFGTGSGQFKQTSG